MAGTVYSKCNHFYLDDTVAPAVEILEPINWDTVDIVIKRDEEFYGTAFQFSDGSVTLKFGNKHFESNVCSKDLIDAAYEAGGLDAKMQLVFGYDNPGYIELFRGELDFTEYVTTPYFTEVQLREIRFDDKIRTRFDAEYNIQDVTKETFVVDSYPQVRDYEGHTTVDEAAATEIAFSLNRSDNATVEANNIDYQNEVTGKFTYGDALVSPIQISSGLRAMYQVEEAGFFNISIDFRFLIRASGSAWSSFITGTRLRVFSSVSDLASGDVIASYNSLDGNPVSYQFTWSGRAYLSLRDEVYVQIIHTDDGPLSPAIIDLQLVKADVVVSQEVLFPHAQKPMINLKVGLQNLLDKIVDSAVPLDSGVLDVELLDFYFQNGLWLRGFTDKTINVKLQDFMSSLKAMFNVGFAMEHVAGVDRFRVEFMEYFFQDVETFAITNTSEFARSSASDIVYNEISTGYNRSSSQEDSDNTLINFHSTQERLSTILKHKNKLDIKSPFIADFVLMEEVMRDIPTEGEEDSSTGDHDLYILKTLESGTIIRNNTAELEIIGGQAPFIQINGELLWDLAPLDIIKIVDLDTDDEWTVSITSFEIRRISYITIIQIAQTSGVEAATLTNFSFTVTNRDWRRPESQEFVKITSGLEFADRAHNTRLSPLRNIYQHGNLLRSGWWNKPDDDVLKFISGKSNTDVTTEVVLYDALMQHGLLQPTVLTESDDQVIDVGLSIFKPTWLAIETEMELVDIFALKDAYEGNAGALNYGYIAVTDPDTGDTVHGYPYEIKYTMGTGKVTMKLLEKDSDSIDPPIVTQVTFDSGQISAQAWVYEATVVAVSVLGLQYSIDGGATWQGSPVFSDLVPDTLYTFTVLDALGQEASLQALTPGQPNGPIITDIAIVGAELAGNWKYTATVSGLVNPALTPLLFNINGGGWGASNVFAGLFPDSTDTYGVQDAILQEFYQDATTGPDLVVDPPVITSISYYGYLSGTWKIDATVHYTDPGSGPYEFIMEDPPPTVYRGWQASATFVDITLSHFFYYKMRVAAIPAVESNTLPHTSPGEPPKPTISSITWTESVNPEGLNYSLTGTINANVDQQVDTAPEYQLKNDGHSVLRTWQSSPTFTGLLTNIYYRFEVRDDRDGTYTGQYRDRFLSPPPTVTSIDYLEFDFATNAWNTRINATPGNPTLSKLEYQFREPFVVVRAWSPINTYNGIVPGGTYFYEARDALNHTSIAISEAAPSVGFPVISDVTFVDEGSDFTATVHATSTLVNLQYQVTETSGSVVYPYQLSNQFFGLAENHAYIFLVKDTLNQIASRGETTPGSATQFKVIRNAPVGDLFNPSCADGTVAPDINMYYVSPFQVGTLVWADPVMTTPFPQGVYGAGTEMYAVQVLAGQAKILEIVTGC